MEWKPAFTYSSNRDFCGLGNVLSGMETIRRPGRRSAAKCLGNFLSGMETLSGGDIPEVLPALETSLVEWKLLICLQFITSPSSLGNFLSGMETAPEDGAGTAWASPWKLP